MRKIEEHKLKKYLMIDDYILNEVLHKIKEIIVIEKFDDSTILVDTDDKLLDYITLKNAVILMRCVKKDNNKFH